MKVGNVVVLKSGGPKLTVIAVRPDGILDVSWFVCGHVHFAAFRPEELRYARFLI